MRGIRHRVTYCMTAGSCFLYGTLKRISRIFTAVVYHFCFGFSNFKWVDTANRRPFVMDFRGHRYGAGHIHPEYAGEDAHYKFEGGVVIIEQNDRIHGGRGDHVIGLFFGVGLFGCKYLWHGWKKGNVVVILRQEPRA